jgi:hypothetical protein
MNHADECKNIETHLRVLMSEADHDAAGSAIDAGRPLHFRVFRALVYLGEQIKAREQAESKLAFLEQATGMRGK